MKNAFELIAEENIADAKLVAQAFVSTVECRESEVYAALRMAGKMMHNKVDAYIGYIGGSCFMDWHRSEYDPSLTSESVRELREIATDYLDEIA